MPRTKPTIQAEVIKDWNECDAALATIAKHQTKIETEEAAYNNQEQIARKKLTDKHAPLRDEIARLELGMQRFCEDHRTDFGEKKSRELKHGTVSFRIGNKAVKALKGFTLKSALTLVSKNRRLERLFVRMKPELNREEIIDQVARYEASEGKQGVNPEELAECGLTVEQAETFGYDIKNAIEN